MASKQLDDLANLVRIASDIPDDKKAEILEGLVTLPKVLDTDPWIYRMVVFFLGFTVISTVIGGIVLTYIGGQTQTFQMPQGVVAIGSAAVGALAGLLAPSPRQ